MPVADVGATERIPWTRAAPIAQTVISLAKDLRRLVPSESCKFTNPPLHGAVNYLAHGFRWLDDPYFVAGTALPDWLSVVDRRLRCRSKQARCVLEHDDRRVVCVARGVLQHHHEDHWFHQTRPFAELSLHFSKRLRDRLPGQDGMRPAFVGHILVELLLDAALAGSDPTLLGRYYAAIQRVDPWIVVGAVEAMSGRSAGALAHWIPRFSEERFLYDYLRDAKLLFRINQVMRRVGLLRLPEQVLDLFALAREQVARRLPEWAEQWPNRVSES